MADSSRRRRCSPDSSNLIPDDLLNRLLNRLGYMLSDARPSSPTNVQPMDGQPSSNTDRTGRPRLSYPMDMPPVTSTDHPHYSPQTVLIALLTPRRSRPGEQQPIWDNSDEEALAVTLEPITVFMIGRKAIKHGDMMRTTELKVIKEDMSEICFEIPNTMSLTAVIDARLDVPPTPLTQPVYRAVYYHNTHALAPTSAPTTVSCLATHLDGTVLLT